MCTHPTLSEDSRDKSWLKVDSVVRKNYFYFSKFLQLWSLKAVKKVKQAILGHENCRIKELDHMLGFTHTGLVESWNALNNKYANKNFYYRFFLLILSKLYFSPSGMFSRAALTAIDWNSNLNRNQVLSTLFMIEVPITTVCRLALRLVP
jgi:hypothetical protein